MVDIQHQVTHWRNSAQQDWDVAQDLVNRGHVRHGLFFAHLALEKLLKAHVCKNTNDLAPKQHNLVRLSELAGLETDEKQLDLLADMNAFNIEGRYPEQLTPEPSPEEVRSYTERTEEVFQWLNNLL